MFRKGRKIWLGSFLKVVSRKTFCVRKETFAEQDLKSLQMRQEITILKHLRKAFKKSVNSLPPKNMDNHTSAACLRQFNWVWCSVPSPKSCKIDSFWSIILQLHVWGNFTESDAVYLVQSPVKWTPFGQSYFSCMFEAILLSLMQCT